MNIPNFWYGSCSFRKSHSICWENSDMAKFGPFKAIFWPKLSVLRVFDLELQNADMNRPNFGMELL